MSETVRDPCNVFLKATLRSQLLAENTLPLVCLVRPSIEYSGNMTFLDSQEWNAYILSTDCGALHLSSLLSSPGGANTSLLNPASKKIPAWAGKNKWSKGSKNRNNKWIHKWDTLQTTQTRISTSNAPLISTKVGHHAAKIP